MEAIILLLLTNFVTLFSVDLYEDDDSLQKSLAVTLKDLEFEPVVAMDQDKEKIVLTKNLVCEDFSNYAMNCIMDSALMYNSSRKSPPMPAKINDWCRAIRHLTNCAIDWNSECKDVTESHFNEEGIKGHMHVVNNVCDDEWFLSLYDDLPDCIEKVSDIWENCYMKFKTIVDRQKNATQDWSHYVTHFNLCCARAQFRRCTLDALFDSDTKCRRDHSATLQKYSVIVSEGDVFQDCDRNMMYQNCPGGDPRPTGGMLAKLMNAEGGNTANVFRSLRALCCTLAFLMCLNDSTNLISYMLYYFFKHNGSDQDR